MSAKLTPMEIAEKWYAKSWTAQGGGHRMTDIIEEAITEALDQEAAEHRDEAELRAMLKQALDDKDGWFRRYMERGEEIRELQAKLAVFTSAGDMGEKE